MLKAFFGLIALTAALSALLVFGPAYINSAPSSNPSSEDCNHIQSFMEISESIKVEKDCQIGVGYSSNVDWNINAENFFQIYEGTNITDGLTPTNHKEIDSHEKFLETFLYFFREGASSERIAMNPQVIREITEWLTKKEIDLYKEAGGHAPKFAERIQKEGCGVFFPGRFSDFTVDYMNDVGVTVKDCDGPDNGWVEDDVHICILYQEGETYFGETAPRSNRFYFIYDPKGSKFEYVEVYHDELEKYQKIDSNVTRHMFAGYQYLEGAEQYDTKDRFKVMKKEWAEMKESNPEHSIHVELAHFNLNYTLHYLMKYLFVHTDSLGLNEQEIYTLLNQYIFYINRENEDKEPEPRFESLESRLSVIDSLGLINTLITRFLEGGRNTISRIQYHTLGHMVTCYDPSKWESGDASLFRAGYTSATYCNMLTKSDEPDICKSHNFQKLSLSDLPSGMELIPHDYTVDTSPAKSGVEMSDFLQYVKIDGSKFICGVISTPVCKNPSKLTGLGDNISSTGFTYQK